MKINANKQEKLEKVIDQVQGRSRKRTIVYSHIKGIVKAIENRLDSLNVANKYRTGMVFICNPNCQKFANSYNGIPQSTQFQITKFPSEWFVTAIERKPCGNTHILFVNESEYKKYYSF